MKKKVIIAIVIIAVVILGWYGYKNWGWFGGKKSLSTIISERRAITCSDCVNQFIQNLKGAHSPLITQGEERFLKSEFDKDINELKSCISIKSGTI